MQTLNTQPSSIRGFSVQNYTSDMKRMRRISSISKLTKKCGFRQAINSSHCVMSGTTKSTLYGISCIFRSHTFASLESLVVTFVLSTHRNRHSMLQSLLITGLCGLKILSEKRPRTSVRVLNFSDNDYLVTKKHIYFSISLNLITYLA